jgi:phosphoglycolate phosphatase
MKKVVLFDFDGTIADSIESFMEIVNILAKKHRFKSLEPEELEQIRSEGAKNIIKKLRIPFYKLPFIGRDMKSMQRQYISQIKPFDGIVPVMHSIKERGFEIGIVTSNSKENVKEFLIKNNMDIFNYMYGDSGIFGKDKIISTFLKENKYAKEDVIYIGDEIRDINACRKVGIKVGAVAWGYNTKEALVYNNPDFLINTPNDLLTILHE